jgi:hypothetical protein
MLKLPSQLAAILVQFVIVNAWAGELSFTSTTASVEENASTLTITVLRTGDVSSAASISIASTDGTAKSPEDYTAISSTLNWAAGSSDSKTVDIAISDNNIVADDKVFTLALSSVTGDTIGSNSTMAVTIVDYEEGILQFDGAVFRASEDSKIAKVKIIRTSGSSGSVGATVLLSNGTAVEGQDYIGTQTSISIGDGLTETTLEITLKNDDIGESTETLALTLSLATGNALLGTQSTSTVEIIDTDADLTTLAPKISIVAENITQPNLIDLSAPSVIDNSKTYLELINELDLLSISRLTAVQTSTGIIEIAFGEDKFYLRPTKVTRNLLDIPEGVWEWEGGIYKFVTDVNHVIDMHPGIASIDTLQEALSALQMPELVITDQGNIEVQKDQGIPKFEKKPNGEIVINASYYDRWLIRPYALVRSSLDSLSGIFEVPHPTATGYSAIALYYKLGSNDKVQYFYPAPANFTELEAAIRRRIGYIDVSFEGFGITKFTLLTLESGRETIRLVPDYSLGKITDLKPDLQGFFDEDDLNYDGINDYRMVYSNGDEQIFYGAR